MEELQIASVTSGAVMQFYTLTDWFSIKLSTAKVVNINQHYCKQDYVLQMSRCALGSCIVDKQSVFFIVYW